MLQNDITDKIVIRTEDLLKEKPFVIIAIDGRCGAGKTTLSQELKKRLSCNVVHMDDFFLRPEQRCEKRLRIPGENVDYERFLTEVLLPLSKNEEFSYRPYVCSLQTFDMPIAVKPSRVTIVEGTYCCHTKLWDYYDLHVFMNIDSKTQMKRIIKRNGTESAKIFSEKWIPMEESYFNTMRMDFDITYPDNNQKDTNNK